ncbi:MAG: ATP-binding cassette domain-containing protein [Actinobacteria bacterium]|mgnify:CR=1 FL=1|jgi:osmoprotectant transport system ATP-binding protein|nr:ATP-binding cassette domain-containing protein [Actinomycetota bacterium]MCO5298732.1 ATP-binding cassette domain-containing protein [Candidatus Nanopelagicales bacterium]MCB9428938.1 ATP-binding cassette domain-containing protein [Actinomycetota bacterium]HPE13442.1 ATP-binding cassette domain-containing protein [Actinomycetota bacterium]HPQ84363.1 ATP-binding cassette domain-containing protein [Actinomycetota bacterium]
MISLQDVTKQYPDGTVAVHELTLEIDEGVICALVGPSGCGKTTTMRMINRLIEPTGGTIRVAGEDVTSLDIQELRRRIGYVIQNSGLFPHYTVRKNVGTVCRLLGWDRQKIAARVDEMLELVDLEPDTFGDRYPHQLSGGQKQRVGVARALAADPPVMLMDEPFGAVDPIARERLQDEFLALHARVRKTVVLVTHDIDEAVKLGDRIAVLKQGGFLEQYDRPAAVLGFPTSDFVADFVGSDRAVKRLRVSPIPLAALSDETVEPGPGVIDVAQDASLYDLLAAVLQAESSLARITPGGQAVRVGDLDRLLQESRP